MVDQRREDTAEQAAKISPVVVSKDCDLPKPTYKYGQLNLFEQVKASPKQWECRSVDIYKREKKVGEGTFGTVFKARLESAGTTGTTETEYVALKKINMENEKEGFPITAIREIKILKKMKHKNIINLKEIVTSKGDRNLQKGGVFLVFEYMEHDLHGLSDKHIEYEPRHIKCLMQQILQGVDYLHSNNVIHRDIKGANLLLNNLGVLKLTDFGLATEHNPHSQRNLTNRVVTLWYRSPELLLGDRKYTNAIDMWSVGCCFAELITSKPLFPGNDEEKQIQLIFEKCGNPSEETWPGVSSLPVYSRFLPKQRHTRRIREEFSGYPKVEKAALDMLDRMLSLNPALRITAKEALNHEYFKTPPLASAPEELPRIESECHELEVKKQINKERNEKKMRDIRQGQMGAGSGRGGPPGGHPVQRGEHPSHQHNHPQGRGGWERGRGRGYNQGPHYYGGRGQYGVNHYPRNHGKRPYDYNNKTQPGEPPFKRFHE